MCGVVWYSTNDLSESPTIKSLSSTIFHCDDYNNDNDDGGGDDDFNIFGTTIITNRKWLLLFYHCCWLLLLLLAVWNSLETECIANRSCSSLVRVLFPNLNQILYVRAFVCVRVYFMMLYYTFFSPILSSSLRPTFWCHFRRHRLSFSNSIDGYFFYLPTRTTSNIEILGICHFFRFTTFSSQCNFHEISNAVLHCCSAYSIEFVFFAVAFVHAIERVSQFRSDVCTSFTFVWWLVDVNKKNAHSH